MRRIGVLAVSLCLLIFAVACGGPTGSDAVTTTTQGGETVSVTEKVSETTTTKEPLVMQTMPGSAGTTRPAETTRKTTASTAAATTTTAAPVYTSPLGGLKLSVLGDSLSSYVGYSNVGTVNTTLVAEKDPGMELFLPSVYQTYWMQVAWRQQMDVLVNNSWPGSLMRGSGGSAGAGGRAVNLHANTGPLNGTKPDVIAVFMGTNDLFWSEAGAFDAAFASTLVTAQGDGAYTYADPADFAESYFIAMHKMTVAYPDAKIFCFTLHPNKGCEDETVRRFNEVIKAVAAYYAAPVVDIYNSELAATDTYLADSLHFTAKGHEVVADLFEAALLKEFNE